MVTITIIICDVICISVKLKTTSETGGIVNSARGGKQPQSDSPSLKFTGITCKTEAELM